MIAALATFALVLLQLSNPVRTPPDDFISSWAAGRLLVTGGNPYDADQVLAVQRTANWTKDIPYRVWYPPWVMPILGAFGTMSYAQGRFLWYVLNIGACLLSVALLWRFFGGPPRWRPVVLASLFTFWPAVVTIRTGQISVLMLLGVAGFFALASRRRWMLAGACLPLVAIKPQFLHLFWIAILIWTLRDRCWQVLLGAVMATLTLVAIAMAADPAIVSQFSTMAANEAPRAPASTLGTALRLGVALSTGDDPFWLQFLPPALSLLWFLPFAVRCRIGEDWQRDASVVVVASMVTTAYGWIYDFILFLVPVLDITAAAFRSERPPRTHAPAIATYLAINAAVLTINVVGVKAFWYVWVPFAFGAWWWRWRPAS